MTTRDSVFWWTAVAHGVLALALLPVLTRDLPAIAGVHPAIKPLKFAVSLALLLGTLAFVMPALAVGPTLRAALTWTLLAAVLFEMVIICTQALRGVPSHFNTTTPLDAGLFGLMGIAAAVIALTVLAIAVLAVVRPLALSPTAAFAVRVGLLLVFLTAISGFAMGGRGTHSIGAADLRVPHFFALHGLQVLPIAALVLDRLPVGERIRWLAIVVLCVGWIALAVGTLAQAFAGRPFRL